MDKLPLIHLEDEQILIISYWLVLSTFHPEKPAYIFCFPKYIGELRKLGLKDLDTDELVELVNHDVSPQFIAELREMG